jgi:hypothetical protein
MTGADWFCDKKELLFSPTEALTGVVQSNMLGALVGDFYVELFKSLFPGCHSDQYTKFRHNIVDLTSNKHNMLIEVKARSSSSRLLLESKQFNNFKKLSSEDEKHLIVCLFRYQQSDKPFKLFDNVGQVYQYLFDNTLSLHCFKFDRLRLLASRHGKETTWGQHRSYIEIGSNFLDTMLGLMPHIALSYEKHHRNGMSSNFPMFIDKQVTMDLFMDNVGEPGEDPVIEPQEVMEVIPF